MDSLIRAGAVAAIGLLGVAGSAEAGPGVAFTWFFQDTGAMPSPQNGVMMRNGLAWPVVVSNANGGSAFTLFPAGAGPSLGSSNWAPIGTNLFGQTSSIGRFYTDSSVDGRVAFAAAGGATSSNGIGGQVSNVGGGWGALPGGTRAVAFSSTGVLTTAAGNQISGVGGYTGMAVIDVDVAPNGDIGVVDAGRRYHHFSAWSGGWRTTDLGTLSNFIAETADLTFDSIGRPHVVASGSGSIDGVVAFDFSTITGLWASTILSSDTESAYVSLASNNKGTVGTAFKAPNGDIIYAYKEDNAPWTQSVVRQAGATGMNALGIAYDYDDLPVIAFNGQAALGGPTTIVLAYDPIVVPEPVAGAMLGGCGLLVLRRRVRRA